jgi:iron complex transport system substrate-binding protein
MSDAELADGAIIVASLSLPQGAQAAAPRIASMNICTDQLLLAIADPAQIMGLSRFSRDARQWAGDKARGFRCFPVAPRTFWCSSPTSSRPAISTSARPARF